MINTPGQMNPSTQRGKLLMENIKNNFYKNIVEIGTWNGLGSTLCVLNSKTDDCNFYSLESNKKFHDIANDNLKDYKNNVNLIHGSVVTHDELKKFSENLDLDSQQKSWLDDDLNNLKNLKIVDKDLPDEIDLLILDGGEFASYLEWEKLKFKSKVVALDDTNVLKNKRVVEELKKDENYREISSTNEGHGFMIFEKI